MLRRIAGYVTKNPNTLRRLEGALDNYLGDFYLRRIDFGNIVKYRTFFPIWDSCEIEINSFCNRDCGFCPRFLDRSGIRKDGNGNKVRKEMATRKVYGILDELKGIGYRGCVRFGRLSEALIDPRYVEFARYAKSLDFSIQEPTNGDILRKNHELCAQLDGLVDKLVIGLYDASNEDEICEKQNWFRQRFKKTKITFSVPAKRCVIRQGAQVLIDDLAKKRECASWPCLGLNKRKLLIR